MASTLSLCDVLTTRRGAKIATIRDGDDDLVFQPDDFLRVVFEPSAVGDTDSQRMNLIIETTPAILEECTRLDDTLIGYIAEHSDRLFNKRFTVEQVRAAYSSPVRHSEKYPATLKTKVDVGTGKYAVVCWDEDGKQVETPESWRQFLIRPRLHVTHLWVMGSAFGPVVRLTDAMLRPNAAPAERKSLFK
jgi:hypothetical protein